ncbi:hypothetical protein [Pedobacter rhizosphaerae]|uniref:hypothetical protein n=1 Tax=Pedobacter rhizosphaerae TaxID=390241 RepID=UPI001113D3FE|nr:hypothetical protein [Pedobacter rhizosphaerae]
METNRNLNAGTGSAPLKNTTPIQNKKHPHTFILSTSSIATSDHFNKIHKRRFHSFGCIHEIGNIPGAGF